ncbi:MAG: outer membrane beta-barrel protein [Bacteroidota bacterium]|nr:outer membrane beta-barrel protein [Bacteroidota bacterium]
MNWSLKKIKNYFFFGILFWGCTLSVQAQSKSKNSYGVGVNAGIGSAFISGNSYQNYMDTTKSESTLHFNKGIHVWALLSMGKKSDIQIGLGFQQMGFARKQTGLKFFNKTYPGIGVGFIEDNSNSEKEITYNYRLNYLQVPIQVNTYLGRSGDFKWVYQFSAGITPQLLLKHNMVANCNPGFSIDGETQFKIDSSGFEARRFAMNMQLGLTIEYRESKNKVYFIQPMLGFYPLPISAAPRAAFPVFASLSVGVLFSSLPNANK